MANLTHIILKHETVDILSNNNQWKWSILLFNYQGVLLLVHELATGCHRGSDPDPDHHCQSAHPGLHHLCWLTGQDEVKLLHWESYILYAHKVLAHLYSMWYKFYICLIWNWNKKCDLTIIPFSSNAAHCTDLW